MIVSRPALDVNKTVFVDARGSALPLVKAVSMC